MLRLILIAAAIASGVWINSVPTNLTAEDRAIFVHDFAGQSLATATFDEQVTSILAVQVMLAHTAPRLKAIPKYQNREPADVTRQGQGICYDRSRFIEKALTYLGMDVRHVSIFDMPHGKSAVATLLTPGVSSHALSEVRTVRGWMLVDSNDLWIGLTKDGRVVSADMIAHDPMLAFAEWDSRVKGRPNAEFETDFAYVIGLYSRHGDFFWPYVPIPDVNWTQLSGWLLGA